MPLERGEVAAATALRPAREHIERIVELAEHLPESDAAFVRAIYERGMSTTELARATHQRRRRVARRLERLVKRVSARPFRLVVRCRDGWPPARRTVGELVFLHGVSQRGAARRAGLSVHHVRQEIARIRALSETIDRPNREQDS